MGNLQPLIDAVNFVKAHPRNHNQLIDYFNAGERCIVSYAATKAGLDDGTYEVPYYRIRAELASILGVEFNLIDKLYWIRDNEAAIKLAEKIITNHQFPVQDEPVIWTLKVDDSAESHHLKGAEEVATFVKGVRAVKPDAVIHRMVWEVI